MIRGKNTEKALAKQLIAGVAKHLSNVSTLTIDNGTFTPAQIEASLQALIDLRTTVEEAKAATMAKIATENTQAVPLRRQLSALVAYVRASFGDAPDVLADFGLKPKKAPTPLTIEKMAAASAKRAATRAARHTMGSKQKKAVKGTITTIVTVPATSAPQPVGPGPVATAPQGTNGVTAPRATLA
jgi:hypothetical protein